MTETGIARTTEPSMVLLELMFELAMDRGILGSSPSPRFHLSLEARMTRSPVLFRLSVQVV